MFKAYIKWVNAKAKKLDGIDIGLVKLSVFAATLFLAKYYPVLLSFDWYVYALVFVLAVYRPCKRAYFTK